MTPLALEWLAKAEGDFEAMKQLSRVRRPAISDSVCFHAQQCIEKYFKACLQTSGKPVPKTHDLIALLELSLPAEPMLEPLRPSLFYLNRYAVAFRYPGESATRDEARDAINYCKNARMVLREILGLESQVKLRKSNKSARK